MLRLKSVGFLLGTWLDCQHLRQHNPVAPHQQVRNVLIDRESTSGSLGRE